MEIKNFTNNTIRIGGNYPQCIDVKNIPNFHTDYGIICTAEVHPSEIRKGRIIFIQSEESKYVFHLCLIAFDEQAEKLPAGKIIFDSSNG